MEKTINGKVYNTATATLIFEEEQTAYNGNNWQSTKSLYKSEDGQYFIEILANHFDINAGKDNIVLVDESDAKEVFELYQKIESTNGTLLNPLITKSYMEYGRE